MTLSKLKQLKILSNENLLEEILEEITKTEKQLFDLYSKKATRQSFKSHQIKESKRKIAQLKTLLIMHLNDQSNV